MNDTFKTLENVDREIRGEINATDKQPRNSLQLSCHVKAAASDVIFALAETVLHTENSEREHEVLPEMFAYALSAF